MNIELIARQILAKSSRCEVCEIVGYKECVEFLDPLEDEYFDLPEEDLISDHKYSFKEGNLGVYNWVSHDGSDDIYITQEHKVVYRRDYYSGERGQLFYLKGDWESVLKDIYERICLEQLSLNIS